MNPDFSGRSHRLWFSEFGFPGFRSDSPERNFRPLFRRNIEIVKFQIPDTFRRNGGFTVHFARNTGKGNIFQYRPAGTFQRDRKFRTDPEIPEIEPLDPPQPDPSVAADPDRIFFRDDVEIVEGNIADLHIARAVFPEVPERMLAVDPGTRSAEHDIAERTVADRVVAGTSQPDPLTAAVKNAVRHRHLFADDRSFGVFPDRTQDQAVIAGVENTVADQNTAAAVDIDPVVVADLLASADPDPGDPDVFAAGKPERPVRRIDKGNSLEQKIPATEELDHSRTRP